MRVLVSSYACEPGGGSEPGKGWNFVHELATQGHDVTVLSCGSHHRAAVEEYARGKRLPPGLRFEWHDVPGWPGPGYANARHIRQHYWMWQMTARKRTRQLVAERDFDVIHHLTWTVLRWPSFLGGLGPRFVFGPVGGGEVAPWPLRTGFPRRGWKVELQRDLINLLSRVDPFVLRCLARADAILVTDEATRQHVPARYRDKTFVVADVYAPSGTAGEAVNKPSTGPAILFAGRLEYWKGVQLALGAIAALRGRYPELSFTVAGTGPEEGYLRSLAVRLGIQDAVRFVGSVPHAAMPGLYAGHDALLFPSLHDSGPHVIGEALAHGLPVVCLDLGGPGITVDASCGAVVATKGRSRRTVELELADGLAGVLEHPDRRARLRRGAKARASMLTYPRHVQRIVETFYCAGQKARAPEQVF